LEIEALVSLLDAIFTLWGAKEANKYRDRYIQLKRDYYTEKTKLDPDMAVLDRLEYELFLLAHTSGAAALGRPTPPLRPRFALPNLPVQ
jgi:hypothetical protein